MTVDDAFLNWLNGWITDRETRRSWAEQRGISLKDLEWAFMAGHFSAQATNRKAN